MEPVIATFINSGISLIIALAGTLVCIFGFKISKRKIFSYAAVFFAATAIPTLALILAPVSSIFINPGNIMILGNFTMVFVYVRLLALALMIWAFYQESQV